MGNVNDTLAERGKSYGTFMDNAEVAQRLKKLLHVTPNWRQLRYDQREALDIIMSKIARMLTGDPEHRDNWHDIAGYATLVDQRMAEAEAEEEGDG